MDVKAWGYRVAGSAGGDLEVGYAALVEISNHELRGEGDRLLGDVGNPICGVVGVGAAFPDVSGEEGLEEVVGGGGDKGRSISRGVGIY